MSTAYHPQTDGQTERMNRTMEDMLRGVCGATARGLVQVLEHGGVCLHNSIQASAVQTPFFLTDGRHPLTPLSSVAPARSVNPLVSV
jgi:hypothetical protein